MMNLQAVTLAVLQRLAAGTPHAIDQLQAEFALRPPDLRLVSQRLHQLGVHLAVETTTHCQLVNPIQLFAQPTLRYWSKGCEIHLLSTVDSTNQYLLNRIGSLAKGTACVAEYQSAGRGRRGGSWISPFGSNIYASLYWQLQYPATQSMGLSIMIGIVTAQFLRTLGIEVQVKWPNDLYLYGRKLGGILVELVPWQQVTHVIIGVGINLVATLALRQKVDQPWIALQQVGIQLNRNRLLGTLLHQWIQALQQFESHHLTSFLPYWPALDYLKGATVIVDGTEIATVGTARGINAQGALLLERQGQLHLCMSGHVNCVTH